MSSINMITAGQKRIGIAALILIPFVGGGLLWFGIRRWGSSEPLPAPRGGEEEITDLIKQVPNPEWRKRLQTTRDEAGSALPNRRERDADFDNLTNAEEQKLGTNPNLPDTDGDGLLDGTEVQLYRTNPLTADSDGDGATDGYEARRGLNPLGPGDYQFKSSR